MSVMRNAYSLFFSLYATLGISVRIAEVQRLGKKTSIIK